MLALTIIAAASIGEPVPADSMLPGRIRDAWQAHGGSEARLVLDNIQLPGQEAVTLHLERFHVTTPGTRFVRGHRGQGDEGLAFDPDSVILLRGSIADDPGSGAFLALVGDRVRGYVRSTRGEIIDLVSPRNRRNPGHGSLVSPGARPPGIPLCGLETGGYPPLPSSAYLGTAPTRAYRLQVAVETDYEYFQLFDSLDDAAAYVVVAYGAIADIYARDVGAQLSLTFVRLWDDPDDLFNQESPLGPFRNWWNENMSEVPRNVAQFFSGRRNFPYGGAAFLGSACNNSGYSVVGYLLGFEGDSHGSSVFNYDIPVTAHELGHNCGAYHTHDYELDACNLLDSDPIRGPIMSYCSQTTSGAHAVWDMRFHTVVQDAIETYFLDMEEDSPECLPLDCNGNSEVDSEDIRLGISLDENTNGVPDECEDCNGNGILDPQDLADATSIDLNLNGVPDECESDCNSNGIPDDLDILEGTSGDTWGNGIPDECESDCNENGLADYNEIQVEMGLDIDRDLVLDECQDCDGDGVTDLDALDGAWAAWVGAADRAGRILAFHQRTGVRQDECEGGHILSPWEVLITPDRRVLVTDTPGNRVVEFDATGAWVQDLVPAGRGGLDGPAGMVIGPDGTLLVSSRHTGSILQYDLDNGTFLDILVDGNQPPLPGLLNLLIAEDGVLLVGTDMHQVLAFDSTDGTFLGPFVTAGDGGLTDPRGMARVPGGNILVASYGTNEILEYDSVSGSFVRKFNKGGTETTLTMDKPWGVRIGPDGHVYVSRNGVGDEEEGEDPPHDDGFGENSIQELHVNATRVYIFAPGTGNFQRSYITGNDTDLWHPTGFDFMPGTLADCNRNAVPDACDILAGTSIDGNGNGIPDECECLADIDANGNVGFSDLLILLGQWGTCTDCAADIVIDGEVNFSDLLFLLAEWGSCQG